MLTETLTKFHILTDVTIDHVVSSHTLMHNSHYLHTRHMSQPENAVLLSQISYVKQNRIKEWI